MPASHPHTSCLIGLRCDVASGVFKAPQVILTCSKVWEPQGLRQEPVALSRLNRELEGGGQTVGMERSGWVKI